MTHRSVSFRFGFLVALVTTVLLALGMSVVHATWSIVITDKRTGEVAIGQATCVAGIDLEFYTPVVVTATGAATVAGYADISGVARATIRDEFYAGTPPAEILQILSEEDTEHETHQYCIVDVEGRCETYSGTVAMAEFDYWGGIAGRSGDVAYSVTGGLLTGAPVVQQAVQAILDTEGSVGDKLMAAMQAARAMGGDGRCSCSPSNPTGCGSPPLIFNATAINGYMLLARSGDTADCVQCSSADLYMNLNVANQSAGSTDPVTQMQIMYDSWRGGQAGRPDAVRSLVTFDPTVLPPDGTSMTQITITLLDVDGAAISAPIGSIRILHSDTSDRITSIGSTVNHGGGVYSAQITAGTEAGLDRFRVFVDDGVRAVTLMPEPELSIGSVFEAHNLVWSDTDTMTWDVDPSASEYHVYGGNVTELDCSFSGSCLDDLDPVRTDTSFTDNTEPLSGECRFYLVSCEDSGGTESSLGTSECGDRPNALPC